jgi:hypothetical protein
MCFSMATLYVEEISSAHTDDDLEGLIALLAPTVCDFASPNIHSSTWTPWTINANGDKTAAHTQLSSL